MDPETEFHNTVKDFNKLHLISPFNNEQMGSRFAFLTCDPCKSNAILLFRELIGEWISENPINTPELEVIAAGYKSI